MHFTSYLDSKFVIAFINKSSVTSFLRLQPVIETERILYHRGGLVGMYAAMPCPGKCGKISPFSAMS